MPIPAADSKDPVAGSSLVPFVWKGVVLGGIAAIALTFVELVANVLAPAPPQDTATHVWLFSWTLTVVALATVPLGALQGLLLGLIERRRSRARAARAPLRRWKRLTLRTLGWLAIAGGIAAYILSATLYVRLYPDIHRALRWLTILGVAVGCVLVAWRPPALVASRTHKWALGATPFALAAFVSFLLASVPRAATPKAYAFDRTTLLAHGLGTLSWLADRDGDGYSPLFNGGDCAEGDPRRNVSAREIVGNGIDENCDGADLTAHDVQSAHRLLAPERAGAQSTRAAQKWNVLLVTIEALRSDRLRRGEAQGVLPVLEREAQRGVWFPRAYAASAWTNPSVYSIFTSRYPSQASWTPVGISTADQMVVDRRSADQIRGRDHDRRMPVPLFDRAPTLAEILSRAGYATATFAGYIFFLKNAGLTRGFETVDSAPYRAHRRIDGAWDSGLVVERLRAFLESAPASGRPFFAWAHIMDPHDPYVGPRSLSAAERYARALSVADQRLGRILETLDARGLREQTLVVLCADHGEEFGEHGGRYHATALYEESIRVPLVFVAPGARARKFDTPVSHVDLAPTILDLLGQPRPAGMMGRSLAPWIAGDGATAAGGPPLRAILSEVFRFENERRALIEGHEKLIWNRKFNTFERYDLRADPHELVNLVAREDAALEDLRRRLLRFGEVLELDAEAGTRAAEQFFR
jgi:arylsulfatase A-like enzyme